MTSILPSDTGTTTVTLTSLLGVYIALGGTLVAASLAAFASFRASDKASATAKEVAELSNKTAQEIKDKEYKNDFYKKVIDRRFKAWDKLESIHQILLSGSIEGDDKKEYPAYCDSIDSFSEITDMMFSLNSETFWMGKNYGIAFIKLHRKLIELRKEATESVNEDGTANLNLDMLREASKGNNKILLQLVGRLINISGKHVRTMYDVEKFFNELDEVGTFAA